MNVRIARVGYLASAAALSLAFGLALKGSGCAESRAKNAKNFAAENQALTVAEVDALLVRATSQANALGLPCAIAVTDREGEVLGVVVMAPRDVDGDGNLDAVSETNIQTAIGKAATASVFQSEDEAFTTRTAYFIVQGHYPPNVNDAAGGPLFGVQDSALVASDVRSIAYDAAGNAVGAGISGELGGVPLFKNGAPVGGIGVDSADVLRTLGGAPTLVSPVMNAADEAIAAAAGRPFETPRIIQATGIFVDGIRFPFVEAPFLAEVADLAATAAALPAGIGALDGRFPVRTSPLPPEVRVNGQFGIRNGRRYAGRTVARFGGPFTPLDPQAPAAFDPAAYRYTTVPIVAPQIRTISGIPGEVKFPFNDGIEPPPAEGGLTVADIETIMANAVLNADRATAAIRLPFGVGARVHIVVVDLRGNILAGFRMNDGTLFSFDVAVQKARTCAFFSTDQLAASARGIGFISRPFFPDGITTAPPGALARLRDLVNRGLVTVEDPPSLTLINPPPRPPADGRQDGNVLQPGIQAFNDFPTAPPAPAQVDAIRARVGAFGGINVLADNPDPAVGFVSPGLQSGMQTFAGGVPLYKAGRLVGAVGVSGDGIDEDDLIAFSGSFGFEPPPGVRIDEASGDTITQTLIAKAEVLAVAMETHPDPAMAAVYGPIFRRERDAIAARLAAGLDGVRLPYVKLPRRPDER